MGDQGVCDQAFLGRQPPSLDGTCVSFSEGAATGGRKSLHCIPDPQRGEPHGVSENFHASSRPCQSTPARDGNCVVKAVLRVWRVHGRVTIRPVRRRGHPEMKKPAEKPVFI